ncbi:mannonate dehydratase [Paraburkholderia sp. RL17-337-BIB-A]|uniref:mannonate dehydratase n=1 Tax=Paraburkholderia sp. RL17-337-BIB-A TaxID=3031636 RepID=UPI0038B72BB0
MKMTFRWYGDTDPVPLAYIRLIPGMVGVARRSMTCLWGGVWPIDRILSLKEKIKAHGLTPEVIESVPVHEDIKLGKATRDALIANYGQTLRHLGACGVKVVCHNFMPVAKEAAVYLNGIWEGLAKHPAYHAAG